MTSKSKGAMNSLHRPTLWDVEYSLALHNRTGKFHIGKAILESQADKIKDVRFWRYRSERLPTGLKAKVLGKLLQVESRARQSTKPFDVWPRIRAKRPILHLDPFTVVLHQNQKTDLVLCHDMGPISHPDLFEPQVTALYRQAYREIARIKPRMVFVSEASRAAFCSLYGSLPHMSIIYPPIRHGITARGLSKPDGATEHFLLTVGSVGTRKNQAMAIRAYRETGLVDQDVSFIICGSREPGYDDVHKEAEATPGVILLPYVTDEELAWLYESAKGFVLVSKLEGFGMPVAEAIQNSLVPLVSAESVLQEVAGSGAIVANPEESGSIAEGLIHLSQMAEEEKENRLHLMRKSIERFSIHEFEMKWHALLDAGGAPNQQALN